MSDLRPHYVYRCFDADGFLIYIGCTANLKQRMKNHRSSPRRSSRWIKACMASHTVDGPFAGLDAGEAAERVAIRAEAPLFNIQERRDGAPWTALVHIARYLVDRGHLELAAETLCKCDSAYGQWCYVHEQKNAAWFAEDAEYAAELAS
ncbi:MAG TPA: GIY-YIG nuclease family protein [Aeromicrobium sp.]|nr:GIY-YIG nuclease family protein [Aeromicrobium sp.]HKY59233.1 GIY-YIG nuclease family protein [Aeromicrobium sp.]